MSRERRARLPATARGQGHGARGLIERADASVLDLVDHLLNKGVMVSADVVLSLAEIELVYLRVSALLCAADKVLPTTGRSR